MATCYIWLFTLKWTEEFSFIVCFVIKSLPFSLSYKTFPRKLEIK